MLKWLEKKRTECRLEFAALLRWWNGVMEPLNKESVESDELDETRGRFFAEVIDACNVRPCFLLIEGNDY